MPDDCFRLPPLNPERAKASKGSVSTLSNGLTIVTEDGCSTSTVSMTYPNAGSASESLGEEGASLINKCLAFRSGSGLSTVLVNRTIENEGATPFSKADRNSAVVGYTVEPDKALGLVPLLALSCAFEKWDVRDAKKLALFQTEEANKSVEVVLTEQIYKAAYGASTPMGRPFYNPEASSIEIQSFRNRGYGVNGAILTATGIEDHAAFCMEVDSLLKDAPTGENAPPPVPLYIGGESRLSSPSIGFAHVALAFEVKAASAMRKILKHCFNQIGKQFEVSAFEIVGIVGVYASATSERLGALNSNITETLTRELTPEIISKAKILAKAEVAFDLDCGSSTLAAAMTASVLETGSFTDAATAINLYNTISDSDVTNAVGLMLKSNPALAAVGDIAMVPYQSHYRTLFHDK